MPANEGAPSARRRLVTGHVENPMWPRPSRYSAIYESQLIALPRATEHRRGQGDDRRRRAGQLPSHADVDSLWS